MNDRLPIATWRAQFTPATGEDPAWRFSDAAKLAPFLKQLGISDLYASPVLEARSGSTHGYDVTDPWRIRKELGGEEQLHSLARALREEGLGIVLDIVPNHMAADSGNPWWWDALMHGPKSRYWSHFDINWPGRGGEQADDDPADAGSDDGRVILPVLGRPLDEALEAGELTVGPRSDDDETLAVCYYDMRFPLAPGTLPAKQLDRGELLELLERQNYRLMFWRDGLRIINYRRFFDVADLVCIRIEDEQVFEDAHRMIFRLVEEGHVRGLRIDHIDGLFDPRQYLRRLRGRIGPRYLIVEKILAHDEPLPPNWPVDGTSGYEFLSHINALFVDAEGAAMIEADAHQRLGASPAFAGEARESKRYVICELFQGEAQRLAMLLAGITRKAGTDVEPDHLHEALVETTAAMEVYRTYITSESSGEVSAEDRRRLTEALDAAEAFAHQAGATWGEALGFVRSILLSDPPLAAPAGREAELEACRLGFIARWQQFTGPAMAKGIEDTALYRRITLASLNDVGCDPDHLPREPGEAFHAFCVERQRNSSASLNTTSTHDTKRGEDTRLRISVLASLASEYLSLLDRWFERHAELRAALPDGPAPRPTDEALIYQSLLGMWPPDDGAPDQIADRLCAYMIKAAREAKLRTSWHQPDEQYEEALQRFVRGLVTGPEGESFREGSRQLRRRMSLIGAVYSLAQVVIKCTAPGIPDFYRGTELWDLSLVDPDNRRPVDFELRLHLLELLRSALEGTPEQQRQFVAQLMDPDGELGWQRGAIKMYTMMRTLALRHRHASLFQRGEYLPLEITGEHASRLFAFARRIDQDWAVTIVPRHVDPSADEIPIGSAWQNAEVVLPPDAPGRWRNGIAPDSGESPVTAAADPARPPRLAVADAFRTFPVAVLMPA